MRPWWQHNKTWVKESKIYQNPPAGAEGDWDQNINDLYSERPPKEFRRSDSPETLHRMWMEPRVPKRFGMFLSDDQQSILLSLRREEEILNLQKHDLNWPKGDLRQSVRRQNIEVPLDSSMSLGRPQVRKNPLSSTETTVPRKNKRFGKQNGECSPEGNPSP